MMCLFMYNIIYIYIYLYISLLPVGELAADRANREMSLLLCTYQGLS